MPFTVNVGPYQGGNYLFQGLSNLGQGVGSAVKDVHTQIDEQRKMEAYNDLVVQHALQNKQITLEDFSKYRDMSRTQKTGFAAGLAANFMEDFRNEQLQSLKESRAASSESRSASAELRRQQAKAFNFEPTEEMKALARVTGHELIQTGPGKWEKVEYGGTGQAGSEADPLKVGDKIIPGMGVVRKTGQIVYFGQSGIERDTKTGAYGRRDTKGNFTPLTMQQLQAMQMGGDIDNPPPAPAQGGGMLDTIINGIFNAVGAPGPNQDIGQQPQPSAADPSGQKVKVKAPDGRIGLIPAEQLQAALAKGYTQVP